MWRESSLALANYDDNGVRCGGNRYKCGVCGDPPEGPFDNEAGGKYGKGIIGRTYEEGEAINVKIIITANHMGWFEFTLCPVSEGEKVTDECLAKNVLSMTNGEKYYHLAASKKGPIDIPIQLPAGISCKHCVLRWRWVTGNSWGVDKETGRGCVGCGIDGQEKFYSCADITIRPKGSKPVATDKPIVRPTPRPTPKISTNQGQKKCIGINGLSQYDQWCATNCKIGNCPDYLCTCV